MGNMTIDGIAHLALTVTDMEKSLDFYCRILGLERAFTLGPADKPSIEYIKVGQGQFIELFYPKGNEVVTTSRSTNNHVCLEVEDIWEVEKTLKENNITITIPPKGGGADGNWQCWCRDPDGYHIEFMTISPTSKQATC